MGKSILNHPEIISDSPPVSPSPTPDQTPAAQGSLAGLTADDILNSNTSQPPSPLIKGSLLSLDGLPTPTRSSARQALGVTIVRQPGRRGTGDQVLEPLLYVQLMQPSVLLSCHHRKQKMELSVFDVALRGVPSDYKCQGERVFAQSCQNAPIRTLLCKALTYIFRFFSKICHIGKHNYFMLDKKMCQNKEFAEFTT